MAKNRICAVEGCGKTVEAKGYCKSHYIRNLKHGSPYGGRPFVRYSGCKVDGCNRRHKSLGYCSVHHWRFVKYGDPSQGGSVRTTRRGEPLEWLLQHVSFAGDDCLVWPFFRPQHGYGTVWFKGKNELAHRVMCLEAHGHPPTPKHEVAHSCGKGHQGCVNPRHLRWATRVENQADRRLHGTSPKGKPRRPMKLTVEKVLEMRSLFGTMPTNKLAQMFGIAESTCKAICDRKSWSWLKD